MDRESHTNTQQACPECGALSDSGRAGCQKLFEEILDREFSDYTRAKVHRLTVDAYSLQHPDRYMKSAKSFAAHLTGIFAARDFAEKAALDRQVQRWLNAPGVLTIPAPPAPGERGQLTVRYVHEAESAEQHNSRCIEWANSVREAWRDYEHLADELLARAEAHASDPRSRRIA